MSSDEVPATSVTTTSDAIDATANPVIDSKDSKIDQGGDTVDTSVSASGDAAPESNDPNNEIQAGEEQTEQAPDASEPQEAPESPFAPRDVVLAKVKGYPSWPAMVLSEEVLPANVAKLKPRTSKKKGPAVPVRFFSDDTYIWIHASDLKHLSQEMIQDHFDASSRKRRKDNMLESAFAMALDPPEMELFAMYGSSLQPDPTAELDDEILEMATDTDPSPKKRKAPATTEGTPRKRAATTKTPRKRSERSPTKKETTKKETAKKEETPRLPGYDDDWGTDDLFVYDKTNGDYILDDEAEQKQLFDDEIGSATEVSARIARANDQFHKVSAEVLKQVVDLEHPAVKSEDDAKVYQIDPQPALAALDDLQKLLTPEFPKAVYAKSSLMRWLVVLARLPEPQFPYPEVRDRITDVLKSSLGFTVPINRPEMMVNPDPTPTPQPESTPSTEGKEEQEEGGASEVKSEETDVKVEANGDAVANGDHNGTATTTTEA
ncbi:hypothetical protein DIURU_001803 [Diutina rugosa]|uniref:PWWP domain-containing protein n=1 Tax=Diutina rugosa TaxID=5481 RepID=A0A642UZJ7_DIURU|nr:uncharacterized protein DIURU_001803 [Diutina rugosa]KAA8904849.1 hypothetical protein DIURU_001803 [Diutina rugosa]